jgi:hypothetical protein
MRIPQVLGLLLVEFNFVNPVFAGNFEVKYRNHEKNNKLYSDRCINYSMYKKQS